MDLQAMINAAAERIVNARLEEFFGDAMTTRTNGRQTDHARTSIRPMPLMRRASDDASPAPVARKRGPGRAQVTYTLFKQRGRRPTITAEDLFPTAWTTYKAIRDAKGPITAKEIEAKTKAPGKTVESTIYFLRHRKLIQSNKIDRSGDE